MKEKKRFIIGSRVFFQGMEGYRSKDDDSLHIMDNWDMKSTIVNFRKDGKDCFLMKDLPKGELIEDTLESNIPMKAGKFLVPAFIEYLGMTISDLKLLSPLFEKIDEAHRYEKVIYDAYIENNGFFLTDGQREAAYREYLKTR